MEEAGTAPDHDPAKPTRLARENGQFLIPAELIAARFGLEPSILPDLMRSGQITSTTEIGSDADAGRWRLTLHHGGQTLRLTVDDDGLIIHQTRFAAPRRAGSQN